MDLDEPLLKKIADETSGRMYRAYDHNELKNIYDEIDKLETSEINAKKFVKRKSFIQSLFIWR